MRKQLPEKLEAGRVRTGPQRSDSRGPIAVSSEKGYKRHANTSLPSSPVRHSEPRSALAKSTASGCNLTPFLHQAPHRPFTGIIERRCPNWIEMCFVKDLFWDDEELVVQFHPPRSRYVNNHPYCLHLWRDVEERVRLPPSELVGLKDRGVLTNEERARIWVEL